MISISEILLHTILELSNKCDIYMCNFLLIRALPIPQPSDGSRSTKPISKLDDIKKSMYA
jgi:hypothetical protein